MIPAGKEYNGLMASEPYQPSEAGKRPMQFSIRSMLIVVAAIALFLAQYPFVDVVTLQYGRHLNRLHLPSWRLLAVMIGEAVLAMSWLIWCRPRRWRLWTVALGLWAILILVLIAPWVLLAMYFK